MTGQASTMRRAPPAKGSAPALTTIEGVLERVRAVTYDYSDLDELVLAYACSIHKSQGSEYPCVVIPVHTLHYMMLQRNLLYTGSPAGSGSSSLSGVSGRSPSR